MASRYRWEFGETAFPAGASGNSPFWDTAAGIATSFIQVCKIRRGFLRQTFGWYCWLDSQQVEVSEVS